MIRKALAAMLAVLVLVPIVVVSAWAMSSTNYRLDWFVLPLGSGGGASSSASYAANFTIGQTATGLSAGPSYAAGLGYWTGVAAHHTIYLPLTLRGL